ncbi:MAG: ABC transporter substrate-binding protein [Deltaproteobacteria bacterium]|nr:ABC transporter substrate-binding protein [Deltaproteobacteria bacterium]
MQLRIGHLSTFYHTSILLMADPETPARLGVEVEWKLFGTGPAIVEAFRTGEIDLAYIGLPPAMIGIASGVPIRCIAGGHMEGTVIVGNVAHRDFGDTHELGRIMEQFRGKTIGVPGTGSIHDVILTDTLDRFNLADTVQTVHFPWADELMEAMFRGEVAAAFGTPALAAALAHYGEGKILYPPRLLRPENPSYGIVAEISFLQREAEITERFLRLHEAATERLRTDPSGAAKILSTFIGFIDEALVLETLKISSRYCAQLTEGYITCTLSFAETLKRLGYIERTLPEKEIFDTTLIKKIHGPGDHYGDDAVRRGQTS